MSLIPAGYNLMKNHKLSNYICNTRSIFHKVLDAILACTVAHLSLVATKISLSAYIATTVIGTRYHLAHG